jgi:hypothetical protein
MLSFGFIQLHGAGFCPPSGLLLSFFLSCQLTFTIEPDQACLRAKQGAIIG